MLDADRIVDIEVNIDRTPVPLRGQSDVYVQVRRTEGERRGETGRDEERRGEKGREGGETRRITHALYTVVYACVVCACVCVRVLYVVVEIFKYNVHKVSPLLPFLILLLYSSCRVEGS